ncbi:Diacylglycerol O-acyltransferase 3 [Euphorbia peplus]|nr:Diacylglycerol O-acyltransferase 3 [Euphorbia peplus]
METAGRIISSSSSAHALRFSGIGHTPSRRLGSFRVSFGGFSDSGHVKYYQTPVIRSGMKEKEKVKVVETEGKMKKMKMNMKLIKRLSKDLNLFNETVERQELGSRLMMSEATEVLLAELENLRTEQKEQKRKRKEEQAKLMKSKARMKSESSSSESSSSSSESSDSEDGGNPAIDMRILRSNNNEAEQGRLGETRTEETRTELLTEHREIVSTTTSSFDNLQQLRSTSMESVSNTKIEICMGGKCKKLGAPMLMEEFEKEIGTEGSVVGCKCMGKCKSAPNVRVCNDSLSEVPESVKCSVQTPTNPLYIGVGLEDVAVIVANLLSQQNWDDSCLLAAS